MSAEQLVIPKRFHGPPDSGNGGYVAGLLAREMGGSDCTVTLHSPPPLERPLDLRPMDAGVGFFESGRAIATGTRADLSLDVPPLPGRLGAEAATRRYVGFHRHRFPSCFVCGPERQPGDGLRIFPGEVAPSQVAAIWVPDGSLADEHQRIRSEFLWAALDCPGYFAVEEAAGLALLGRITAVVEDRVDLGEELIVSGWAIESQGRKHSVGTAVHRANGEVVAKARSIWITLAG